MLREQSLFRWWVYIVPKGENFYVGITTDPPNRLRQHGSPTFFYLKGPLERALTPLGARIIKLDIERDIVKFRA